MPSRTPTHSLAELVWRCTLFTLSALRQVNEKTIEALQTSSATPLVKALQMKALKAVDGERIYREKASGGRCAGGKLLCSCSENSYSYELFRVAEKR